jgi:hypothetical protein
MEPKPFYRLGGLNPVEYRPGTAEDSTPGGVGRTDRCSGSAHSVRIAGDPPRRSDSDGSAQSTDSSVAGHGRGHLQQRPPGALRRRTRHGTGKLPRPLPRPTRRGRLNPPRAYPARETDSPPHARNKRSFMFTGQGVVGGFGCLAHGLPADEKPSLA